MTRQANGLPHGQVELMGYKDIAAKCMHIVRVPVRAPLGRQPLRRRLDKLALYSCAGQRLTADSGQNFGMVLGMSTRKGTVKFLDDILRDVGDKMHEVMRSNEAKYSLVENPAATADTLGISSVMVQDMTGKR